MLGVGAQTVLLCAHLLALHHGEKENPHANFVTAARAALGLAFVLIVASGIAAVGVHIAADQPDVLFAPAFMFKWMLILVLLAAYALPAGTEWSNIRAWLTGGTWFALFLVHSIGPVTTWATLFVLYTLWLVFFAAVWTGFVLTMRRSSRAAALSLRPQQPIVQKSVPPQFSSIAAAQPPQSTVAPIVPPAPKPAPPPPKPVPPPPPPPPKPVSPPPPAPKPVAPAPPPTPVAPAPPAPPIPVVTIPAVVASTPPIPPRVPVVKEPSIGILKRFLLWIASHPKHTPAPEPAAVAPIVPPPTQITPPAPKPAAPPPTPPAPVAKAPLTLPPAEEVLLAPVPQPLRLASTPPPPPPPQPKPVQPPPKEEPKPVVPKHAEYENIELMPPLHVMPQTPEDIGNRNRKAVVKLDEL